jgi:hypothetical protein
MGNLLKRATLAIYAVVALVSAAVRVETAGLPASWITELAVDPADAAIVYAATGVGLYKSTDAGESWTRIGADLPWPDVTAVAIDPTAPCTVYAGLDSHLFGRSSLFPVPMFFPDNTSNLLFVSTDCGATWTLARNYTGRAVHELTFTSKTPPSLLARVTVNSSQAGVPYLLEDVFHFTPTTSSVVFSDGGLHPIGAGIEIATDPSDPCVAYVGNNRGHVWKTTNCAFVLNTWDRIGVMQGTGGEVRVMDLAVHPADHSLLVATFGGKLYRKTDDAPWTEVLAVPSPYVLAAVTFAPGNGHVAYAAAAGAGGPVYKSIDGGVTWYPTTRLGVALVASGSTPVLRNYGAGYARVHQFGCNTGVSDPTASPDCAFTDPVLTPQAMTIKAAHITELRTRINRLRTRYQLPEVAWADAVLEAGVTPVRAQHVLELRQALAAVYESASQAAPEYTDPDLGAGTIAKGVHPIELRHALEAME